MNSELWFAQAVGGLAFLIGITTFLQKDDQLFRRQLTVYCGVIGAHFFLMGSPAAGISAILSGMRSLASSRTRNGWVMVGFILLVWALGLPRLAHPMQLLPLIGTTTGTWGCFACRGSLCASVCCAVPCCGSPTTCGSAPSAASSSKAPSSWSTA